MCVWGGRVEWRGEGNGGVCMREKSHCKAIVTYRADDTERTSKSSGPHVSIGDFLCTGQSMEC